VRDQRGASFNWPLPGFSEMAIASSQEVLKHKLATAESRQVAMVEQELE
jgi:hypothetical protein